MKTLSLTNIEDEDFLFHPLKLSLSASPLKKSPGVNTDVAVVLFTVFQNLLVDFRCRECNIFSLMAVPLGKL